MSLQRTFLPITNGGQPSLTCLIIIPPVLYFYFSNVMNMEIFVKEQYSVHSVAIYLTLFSLSLKVLQPLMTTAGGM